MMPSERNSDSSLANAPPVEVVPVEFLQVRWWLPGYFASVARLV